MSSERFKGVGEEWLSATAQARREAMLPLVLAAGRARRRRRVATLAGCGGAAALVVAAVSAWVGSSHAPLRDLGPAGGGGTHAAVPAEPAWAAVRATMLTASTRTTVVAQRDVPLRVRALRQSGSGVVRAVEADEEALTEALAEAGIHQPVWVGQRLLIVGSARTQ